MTWQERLDRIRELRPAEDPLGPVVRCVRCRDSGVIEFTGGTVTSYRGLRVEASPERPVYRRCGCMDKSVPLSAERADSRNALENARDKEGTDG